MKSIDIIRRAGRSLRQARVRTLLTSLAIAVGAFTIMLSIAAGEGARQYADTLISTNVDPKALFIVKDKTITGGAQPQTGLREYDEDAGQQNGLTIKLLNKNDIAALKERTDLTDVRPVYQVQATYITIEGFDKKYSSDIETYNPDLKSENIAGNLPALGVDIGNDEVVVPKVVADTLQLSPKQLIGKTITIVTERPAQIPSEAEIEQILSTEGPSGLTKLNVTETSTIRLKVRGIVSSSQVSFTSPNALQIPIGRAEQLADFRSKDTDNYQKYFAATAKVVGDTQPETVKKDLEKSKLYAQTAKDLQGFLFTIVNILQGIVAGFGVLALLASVFGIINTQYISVLERTSQIGLMKALGARRRDVARLFRYEAAWIGFLGGTIGALLAWGVGEALNPWISSSLELGDDTSLLIFQPLPGVILVAALVVVAVVAGFFPSRKAAKLDPIEALRTE